MTLDKLNVNQLRLPSDTSKNMEGRIAELVQTFLPLYDHSYTAFTDLKMT